MIFEYFRSLGTLPGGLGHILSPRDRILWFWRIFGAKGAGIFCVFFDTFCIFFAVFLNAIFSWFFVILGAQRLDFTTFLDHFSGRSAKAKKCVWTAQACADCICSLPKLNHFPWLFRGCSQGGLRNTILQVFKRFWAPWGWPFGFKKTSKKDTEKML